MGHGTTKIYFRRKLKDGNFIEAPLTIDNDLKETLDRAKKRNTHDWDYVAIVAGIPGAGKSQFVKNTIAPYLCKWFSTKYIAFTAEEFVNITQKCPDYSAVMLDEGFAGLNSKIMWTPEFQKIINHLQLIRQKRLFIFLCLPNFFDLAKGIAIFRASHLFVPYENKQGKRGDFAAFDRNDKRKLYVLGNKFTDYTATDPTFHGRFFKNTDVVDEEEYQRRKREHFLMQDKRIGSKPNQKWDRDKAVYHIYTLSREKYKKLHPGVTKPFITNDEIAEMFDLSVWSIGKMLRRYKKRFLAEKTPIIHAKSPSK